MNILFLAPQPFFEERGTPIAVKLAMQALSRRKDSVDLLTYHQGKSTDTFGARHIRAGIPSFIRNVPPGISLKKLICDFFFTISALRLVFLSRKKYDLIHAVEESVFIALLCKFIGGIPYVYDMDSSIALQTTEKWRWLRPLHPILRFFEGLAIKNSVAVVPVCEALAGIAVYYRASEIQLLRDVSLLEKPSELTDENNLRLTTNAKPGDKIILYIGNLEAYQGIDLLIEAFALAHANQPSSRLVIIGGSEKLIAFYKDKIVSLGIENAAFLAGPRPVNQISTYLLQADILTSPRTLGNNTPMKIYSYLHSGIPILATDLPTHTQVLNSQVAVLAEANSKSFAKAMEALISDDQLRTSIGNAARTLAENNYTYQILERDLNALYDKLTWIIHQSRQ